MSRFTAYTTVLAVYLSLIVADPCRFEHTKGVIDLTSLGKTDGTAAYPDVIPSSGSGYKYSYNPCRPFSEGTACKNVAVCQVATDGKFQFTVGTQESAAWNPGAVLGSVPSVTYLSGQKQAIVQLRCGQASDNKLETLGEGPTNTYKFTLTHRCACWDGCNNSPATSTKPSGKGGKGGLSGGGVFLILLLVLFVVYFVGFAAFYRFKQERSGADLIAHRTFWVALPGYAKDGVVHLYQRVSNRGGNTYNSV